MDAKAKNPHQDWAEAQIAGLVEAGVDLLDAQRTVNELLATLPDGVNPATWIPTESYLSPGVSAADVADARADWYAKDSVPGKFKRLLDAVLDVE